MLKGKTNITKLLIVSLMIGLVSWITFNNIVFLHTHQLGNGSIVIHAHPHEKVPGSESGTSHKHTVIELFNIENLSLLFLSAFAIIAVERVFCIQHKFTFKQNLVPLTTKGTINDRAPPVLLCS